MIKAIIFDGDGVIFDSEDIHKKAWEMVFRKRGLNLSLLEEKGRIGIADKEFISRLKEENKIPPYLSTETLLEEKISQILRLVPEIKLFPEAKETLMKLSKKYLLGLATNSSRRYVEKLISHFYLSPFFSVIVTGEDVARPKPYPDIYLLAFKRLKVNPRECVVVEDSPSGVRAGIEAGAWCIGITHIFPPSFLKNAHTLLPSISAEGIERAISSFSTLP
ncbi:HAD family phosphatase [Candidatus Calescamantes bacterium]|nr:HAD family phosphatase [Candidatus Calescamantes bacterium]